MFAETLVGVGKRLYNLFMTHYMLVPKLVFIGSCVKLINQLSEYSIPGRRRVGIATQIRWVPVIVMVTQELWEYLAALTKLFAHAYKKGEPYSAGFGRKAFVVPTMDSTTLSLLASIAIAGLPGIISYVIVQRQRNWRLTWHDPFRRRYRNEIGSARYYLIRPLSPIEKPGQSRFLEKCRSEEMLPRRIKPLPKTPRTA